jgi:hypothetical protein
MVPRTLSLIWLGTILLGFFNLGMTARRHLHRQLGWLVAYLALVAGFGSVLWILAPPRLSPRNYTLNGMVYQGLLLVVTMMLVHSFWVSGFAKYRGLHRLCAVVVGVTVSAGVFVVLLTLLWGAPAEVLPANWILQWVFLLFRSVMFVVAGLLCVFFALASIFRIPVSRIIWELALGLFFFSCARILLDSWTYLQGPNGMLLNYLRMLSSVILEGAWCLTIVRHRAADSVATAPVLVRNTSREDLERQMDTINLALLRLTGSHSPR